MSITVIFAPFRGPSVEQVNSDHPGNLMDNQNVVHFLPTLARVKGTILLGKQNIFTRIGSLDEKFCANL